MKTPAGEFFGGIKGALRIPSLSFQYLRRPGCTAKLVCFDTIGGFDPHRPDQSSSQCLSGCLRISDSTDEREVRMRVRKNVYFPRRVRYPWPFRSWAASAFFLAFNTPWNFAMAAAETAGTGLT